MYVKQSNKKNKVPLLKNYKWERREFVENVWFNLVDSDYARLVFDWI